MWWERLRTQLAVSELPGSAFLFWPKLALIWCFPTFSPSQREALAAPSCLHFHLWRHFCCWGLCGKVSSGTDPARSLSLSSANPGLALGTIQATSWRPLNSSSFLIISSYYPNSLQMHGHIQELCSWAQLSFYSMVLLSTNFMRSLLRNKQGTAWSPVSLRAIQPCCHQLHWNYPEYLFGWWLNFARDATDQSCLGCGLRARSQAVIPDEVLLFDLVWKQWFIHTGVFPCSQLFCSVPASSHTRAQSSRWIYFPKDKEVPHF